MKVARPTAKPSTSLTGASSMVAIKPPVPIVDLYIISCIAFSLRQGQVGVCSDQPLMPSRNHLGRSPLHPMPRCGQWFR